MPRTEGAKDKEQRKVSGQRKIYSNGLIKTTPNKCETCGKAHKTSNHATYVYRTGSLD